MKSMSSVVGFAAISFALASSAAAQVASALVREGEQLAGAAVGEVVSSINNPAANQVGGYSFGVNTTNDAAVSTSHIWGNASGGLGAPLQTEGVFGALVQTGFESFFGMADSGAVAYSPSGTGGPVGDFDSVWRDDTPLALEGDPISSLPGQFWRFASRPGITSDGNAWWVAGTTSVQGGNTENRGLFREPNATVVLLGGQAVPNLPSPLNTATAVSFDFRFSALGTNYLAEGQMTGSTVSDDVMILSGAGLLLDGELVREDSPIPAAVGGLAGERWDNFDFVSVTETGSYFFSGDSTAATSEDEFIVRDGVIILREGQFAGGAQLTASIESAFMNEQGDLGFVWQIVTDVANREALYLNGRLLLIETDQVDFDGDGALDANATLSDFTGISALVVGPRVGGVVTLYFTGDVNVGGPILEAGFALAVRLADLTFDGCVDQNDLNVLLADFGCDSGVGQCPGDIDGNGVTDQSDLNLLLADFGGGC